MTAAPVEPPGTVPPREWRDADGHTFTLSAFRPGDQCAVARLTDHRVNRRVGHDVTGAVAFTATQLREIAAHATELAEALENVPGRHRRTWRWHVREGEHLLSQARNHLDPGPLVQRATAHFLAAAVLRGQTTSVHIHEEPGRDSE